MRLEEFEKHDLQPAEDKDESNKPFTIAVNTTQGSLVVDSKVDKSQDELADPADYVIVLGSGAEQYFAPSEDSSRLFLVIILKSISFTPSCSLSN